MAQEPAWPVPISPADSLPIACGTLVFRTGGETCVTVLAKATFAVAAEAVMEPTAAQPLAVADAHFGERPQRSLRLACETAPYLPKAEVLVTGHAFAPPGRPATDLTARLAIMSGTRVVFDKALRIRGDVDAAGRVRPFAHMPLVYERALFDAEENPVGILAGKGGSPNIFLARAPDRPGGFGPLARSWPVRARLAANIDPANLSGPTPYLPAGFAWAYFHAAPRDQHINFLQGDELLVLGGLHPALPLLRTRLPQVRAEALLWGPSGSTPVPMRADMLLIDTAAQTVSLVWRGHVAVSDAQLATLQALVGVRSGGAAINLVAPVSVVIPDANDDDDQGAGGGTVMIYTPPAPAAPPVLAADDDDEGVGAGTVMLQEAPPVVQQALQSLEPDDDGLGGETRFLPSDAATPTPLPFVSGPAIAPDIPRVVIPSDDDESTVTLAAAGVPVASPSTLPFDGPPAPAAAPPAIVPTFPAFHAEPPPPLPVVDEPPPPVLKHAADDDEDWGTMQLSPADAARLIAPIALPFAPTQADHAATSRAAAAVATPRFTAPASAPAAAPPAAPPGSPWAEVDPSLPAPAPFSPDDQEATQTLAYPDGAAELPVVPGGASPPPTGGRVDDAIPVFASAPFVLATLPWQVRPPKDSLTVVVKGSFALVSDGPASMLPEADWPNGDVHLDDDNGAGVVLPSDFAIWKPKADVVVKGHAYAPGGSSPAAEVTFRFGEQGQGFFRRLAVFGDRQWQKGLLALAPTAPQPFQAIPLIHERAFGGEGFDANPVGRGYKAAAGPDGVAWLPNIEDPQHLINAPSDKPFPASLGPIAQTWKARWSLIGHYDTRWLKTRWPYFPEDFNWAHFQSAPASQQLPYLRGDEPFEVTGMHPSHPRFSGTLPCLRARCFTLKTKDAGGALEEVILRLDTVVFDLDSLRLHLTWRAVIEVENEDAPEIEAFYLMSEALDATTSREDARARLAVLMAPADEVEENPDAPTDTPTVPANDAEPETPEDAALRQGAEATLAELDRELDAAELTPPDEPPLGPADPEVLRAAMLGAGMSEEDAAELVEAMNTAGERPPRRQIREEVLAHLAAGEPLDGLELDRADLSGIDFSGTSLVGASLRRANLRNAVFRNAALQGALFSGSDLRDANFEGAEASEADFTATDLTGACFDGAELSATDFSQSKADGLSCRGAKGEGVIFAECGLSGARFDGCNFVSADFTRARLDGVVFAGSTLDAVLLYDVEGDKTSFEEAVLSEARGDGARLTRATFRKLSAPGSVWEKAQLDDSSFVGANLKGASFVRASCLRVVFSGADLSGARMRRVDLAGGQLFQANLMGASLERANLKGADLRRANLHEAETWKAELKGADLDFAIVTRTKLRGGP